MLPGRVRPGSRGKSWGQRMSELELFQLFVAYSPATGDMRWRADRQQLEAEATPSYKQWLTKRAGRQAGTTVRSSRSTPHRMLKVRGKCYQAARVAWMLGHGEEIPAGYVVAHIDGNCLNLQLSNLSLKNRRHEDEAPKSGCPGVSWFAPHQRWRVFVKTGTHRARFVGTFESLDEAIEAKTRATA